MQLSELGYLGSGKEQQTRATRHNPSKAVFPSFGLANKTVENKRSSL